jgi:hypothetical protein
MIDEGRRQLQRIVMIQREGILGPRFRSKRPYNILNKTPVEIEKRIIIVRKAPDYGSEQVTSIVDIHIVTVGRHDNMNKQNTLPSIGGLKGSVSSLLNK